MLPKSANLLYANRFLAGKNRCIGVIIKRCSQELSKKLARNRRFSKMFWAKKEVRMRNIAMFQ